MFKTSKLALAALGLISVEASAEVKQIQAGVHHKYIDDWKDLDRRRKEGLLKDSDAFKTMAEICNENGWKTS